MLNNGLQLQYPHLGLPFIGIECSNMIKMVISMFNAIYICIFVYYTLAHVGIM
jgi:hypothetical protein